MTSQEEYVKLEPEVPSSHAYTLCCPKCGGIDFQLHCFGQPTNIFTYCPCGTGFDVTELWRADKDKSEDVFWNAVGSRKTTSPIGYGIRKYNKDIMKEIELFSPNRTLSGFEIR